MKYFAAKLVLAVAVMGLCGLAGANAADMKTKAANEAHSDAPSAIPEGAPLSTSSSGTTATGEGLQGLPSPQMTKFITSMKKCHKDGRADQTCHDRVMKDCRDKMTTEECSRVMSEVQADLKAKEKRAKKM